MKIELPKLFKSAIDSLRERSAALLKREKKGTAEPLIVPTPETTKIPEIKKVEIKKPKDEPFPLFPSREEKRNADTWMPRIGRIFLPIAVIAVVGTAAAFIAISLTPLLPVFSIPLLAGIPPHVLFGGALAASLTAIYLIVNLFGR